MSPRALTACLCIVVLGACSGGAQEPVVTASQQADAARLQELLGSDPARVVLQEIEQAVDSERPVMASEMIEQGGLPAVRRQIERLQAVEMTTQEGRGLRTRAVRIHRARVAALESYRDALARGIGTEDEELLTAMRAYAEAELEIVSLYDDLAAIRPLAPSEEGADRGSRLEGLRRPGEGAAEGAEPPPTPDEMPDPSAGEPREPLPEL